MKFGQMKRNSEPDQNNGRGHNTCVQATPDCALLFIVAGVFGAPDAIVRGPVFASHIAPVILLGMGFARNREVAMRQYFN